MTDKKNEGRDADNKMPNGGAMGNIDDLQGHPGRGQAPGPAMKGNLAEPDPIRTDAVQDRKDRTTAPEAGKPWWAK